MSVDTSDDDHSETRTEVVLAREILEAIMSRTYAHLNNPFMDEVNCDELGLKDYKLIVTEPMWLRKMAQKFADGVYHNIREFVCDFRLMLLNCYRYNGTSSRMGRFAEKLELLFEQKLQLLSNEIRTKTSIQSTLGCTSVEEEMVDCDLPRRRSSNRLFLSGDSRQLTPVRAIMEELEHAPQPGGGGVTASLVANGSDLTKYANGGSGSNSNQSLITSMSTEDRVAFLVARLSLWRNRRHEEALLESWNDWWLERDGPAMKHIVNHTPELLEAYQFLWLADPFLGISDYLSASTSGSTEVANRLSNNFRGLCLYDLEIGLSTAPRECRVLAACMTTLLATPRERTHLISLLGTSSNPLNSGTDDSETHTSRRSRNSVTALSALTLLDYEVWERRLSARVESWYRSFIDKGKSLPLWATRRLGLTEHFFSVCGSKSNPLETKRYHELPLFQRIQLLHALCETTLRNIDNLRTSLDKCADWDASRPVELGVDRFSNHVYIHFPNLLGSESSTMIRIYRLIHVKPDCMSDYFDQEAEEPPNPSTEYPIKEEQATTNTTDTSPCTENLELSDSEDLEDMYDEQSKKSSRGRKRKSNKKQNSKVSKNDDDLVKHDSVLSETGISVPGPVQRLPNWIHPSLARQVYRRWCELSQRMFLDSQQPDTMGTKLDKQNRKKFFNNPGLFLNHLFQTTPSRGRKKNTSSIPFANFESHDINLVDKMMAEEPALKPSKYATLIGPSRRFLSMQLSRSYSGPLRIYHKANSRRGVSTEDSALNADNDQISSTDQPNNDVASSTASQFESDDEDNRTMEPGDEMQPTEDDQLSSTKDNLEDSKRISFTINSGSEEEDELGDADTDETDATSKIKQNEDRLQSPNTSGFEDGLFSRMQDLIKRATPPEKVSPSKRTIARESPEPNSQSTPSKDIKPDPLKEEIPAPMEDPPVETVKSDVPKPDPDSFAPVVKTEDEETRQTLKEDEDKSDVLVEETNQETLITEPDCQNFALVASDMQELDALLNHLNQIMEEKQTKLDELNQDPDCSLDDIDSSLKLNDEPDEDTSFTSMESSRKRRKLSNCTSDYLENKSDRQMKRELFEKALIRLSDLIDNLENLRKTLANRDSERIEAQKLACLRLRKDVELWEQKEAEKKKEAELKALAEIAKLSPPESTPQSVDTSKDRAQRHLKREQRKEKDHFDGQVDEAQKLSRTYEKSVNREPTPSDKLNRLSIPTIPPWRSNLIGRNAKLPIARIVDSNRTSLTEVTPKIRRTAFIDPTKSSSSISKLSQFRSIYPNSNNSSPGAHRVTLAPQTPYAIRLPQVIRQNTQRPTINYCPNSQPIPVSNVQPNSPTVTTTPPPITIPNNQPQLSSPSSSSPSNPTASVRPTTPLRKIYRVYDTLFTEEARPVKIGPNGSLIPVPLEEVPPSHQQLARLMISKYNQSIEPKMISTNTVPISPASTDPPLPSSMTTVSASPDSPLVSTAVSTPTAPCTISHLPTPISSAPVSTHVPTSVVASTSIQVPVCTPSTNSTPIHTDSTPVVSTSHTGSELSSNPADVSHSTPALIPCLPPTTKDPVEPSPA